MVRIAYARYKYYRKRLNLYRATREKGGNAREINVCASLNTASAALAALAVLAALAALAVQAALAAPAVLLIAVLAEQKYSAAAATAGAAGACSLYIYTTGGVGKTNEHLVMW